MAVNSLKTDFRGALPTRARDNLGVVGILHLFNGFDLSKQTEKINFLFNQKLLNRLEKLQKNYERNYLTN